MKHSVRIRRENVQQFFKCQSYVFESIKAEPFDQNLKEQIQKYWLDNWNIELVYGVKEKQFVELVFESYEEYMSWVVRWT